MHPNPPLFVLPTSLGTVALALSFNSNPKSWSTIYTVSPVGDLGFIQVGNRKFQGHLTIYGAKFNGNLFSPPKWLPDGSIYQGEIKAATLAEKQIIADAVLAAIDADQELKDKIEAISKEKKRAYDAIWLDALARNMAKNRQQLREWEASLIRMRTEFEQEHGPWTPPDLSAWGE